MKIYIFIFSSGGSAPLHIYTMRVCVAFLLDIAFGLFGFEVVCIYDCVHFVFCLGLCEAKKERKEAKAERE